MKLEHLPLWSILYAAIHISISHWWNQKTFQIGGNMGTEAIKKVLDLILDGLRVGVQASADGAIDFKDLPLLLQVIPDIGPAIAAIPQFPAQLSDLDAAE